MQPRGLTIYDYTNTTGGGGATVLLRHSGANSFSANGALAAGTDLARFVLEATTAADLRATTTRSSTPPAPSQSPGHHATYFHWDLTPLGGITRSRWNTCV